MFNWIRSLFGSKPLEDKKVEEEFKIELDPADRDWEYEGDGTKVKKDKTVEVEVDLNSMKKNELLAHAKANGVKANASMNKAALIEAIKHG